MWTLKLKIWDLEDIENMEGFGLIWSPEELRSIVHEYFVKKLFRNLLHSSQESTSTWVFSFVKLQASAWNLAITRAPLSEFSCENCERLLPELM